MFRRIVVLSAVALTCLGAVPRPGSASSPSSLLEGRLISGAALRLAHQPRSSVLNWLRHHAVVRTASLDADGATIEIRFRDGRRGVIVSDALTTVRVPIASHLPRLRANRVPHQVAAGARAVVLEPFAQELDLGPNVGDVEVKDLQSAGFQVDQAYDTAVTVDLMSTLPRYSVVYMHTHSGSGIVVTGQPAACSPYSNADGSVIGVGVLGTDQCYLAITPTYITSHMSQFPTNALVFVNGCKLRGTQFWPSLQQKGVGALVSWDNLAIPSDEFFAAAGFFYYMDGGASVASALGSLLGAGYGHSSYNGTPATIGFEGNGNITLRSVGGSPPSATATPTATSRIPGPPAPTSTPTSVPTATRIAVATNTSVPTATTVPTATNTSVPAVVPALSLSTATVRPGGAQTLSVHYLPGASVSFEVTFPNGDTLRSSSSTDTTGDAHYAFTQAASKITRGSSVALVRALIHQGETVQTAETRYTIGFGKMDVDAEPRQPSAGSSVTVYVHSLANKRLVVLARAPHGKLKKVGGAITGPGGWTHVSYKVPVSLPAGSVVDLRAQTRIKGKQVHSATSIVVE